MGDNKTPRRIKWIQEEATDQQILALWRFEPSSSPWLDGAIGDALVQRFKSMRERLSTDEWVNLSKQTGWTPPPGSVEEPEE